MRHKRSLQSTFHRENSGATLNYACFSSKITHTLSLKKHVCLIFYYMSTN